MAQLDACPTGGQEVACSGWQHSFMETDHEISMVILSLLLIQEGQLSVSGERMCTLRGLSLSVKMWLGKQTMLGMTPLG